MCLFGKSIADLLKRSPNLLSDPASPEACCLPQRGPWALIRRTNTLFLQLLGTVIKKQEKRPRVRVGPLFCLCLISNSRITTTKTLDRNKGQRRYLGSQSQKWESRGCSHHSRLRSRKEMNPTHHPYLRFLSFLLAQPMEGGCPHSKWISPSINSPSKHLECSSSCPSWSYTQSSWQGRSTMKFFVFYLISSIFFDFHCYLET